MIKIDLKGFDKAALEVEKLAEQTKYQVREALADFGTKVETQAKRAAPADEGKLRNSINTTFPTAAKGFSVAITVAANYAAYMEFGTRKFAAAYVSTLPQDWKAYAATFKGKGGGSFDSFLKAIMAWVKRKGIGGLQTKSGNVSQSKDSIAAQEQVAYVIALSILRKGVRPQPFLYPAVKAHTPELIKDIQNIFK
jgi:HK97 gp10 family phage protein